MKVGTKSVLFGAHCFLFHWLLVARGWFHLYGFKKVWIGVKTAKEHGEDRFGNPVAIPYRLNIYASILNPKVWVAFFVHDLGYWGKPNMDGEEGERHPEWACGFMNEWFGEPWGSFVLDHSRFYARKYNRQVSALCFADKLVISYEPARFYLWRTRLSGELDEYLRMADVNSGGQVSNATALEWFHGVQDYCRKWVEEHKDGRVDTWTTNDRKTFDNGVWK